MILGVLTELHRAALAAVGWAESVEAISRTPNATQMLVDARKFLAGVELVIEMEKRK